jgi:hypothetical protein
LPVIYDETDIAEIARQGTKLTKPLSDTRHCVATMFAVKTKNPVYTWVYVFSGRRGMPYAQARTFPNPSVSAS